MIISLSGFAQAGKDETAKHLVLNHGFVRVAFADKVKELAVALNPLVPVADLPGMRSGTMTLQNIVTLVGWDAAKQQAGVRKFLQDVGNSVRNVLDEFVWIAAVEEAVLSHRNVVITDARYVNELTWVSAIGGKTVVVKREGVLAANDHISETQWNGWNFAYALDNSGTIEELHSRIDEMLPLL